MHTLHSYIATDAAGRLRAVGGTPGAMQQPQTNLQVLDAVLRHGVDPQDALDAPRWAIGGTQMVLDHGYVMVEAHTPDQLSPAFQDAGIEARTVPPWSFGRAFLALVDDAGIAVAADLRGEGVALVV
jgi:gamma-glutamyltranspeptidase/glutathione hydrolase